jgi:hypothetical protein
MERSDLDQSKANFWRDVEKREEGLSGAIGCYVFGLETNDKIMPWYVGKTLATAGFKGEVFTPHKINHYKSIIRPMDEEKSHRKGTPFISLFPLMTPEENFSKSRTSSAKLIGWLETTMIGMALSKNHEIANTSNTLLHRNVVVPGVLGVTPGRPSREAEDAYKLFY